MKDADLGLHISYGRNNSYAMKKAAKSGIGGHCKDAGWDY